MAEIPVGELAALANDARPDLDIAVLAGSDATVSDVTLDSRRVQPGSLFACVRGDQVDGHDFAVDAVDAGATALLTERPLGLGVAEITAADTREAVGWVAAAFHGFPSRRLAVVGITGTNGKTTSAHLLTEVLRHHGRDAVTIGTLSGAHTTPDATELQRRLADAVASGADAVVMEVSSHALAQHRVDGTWFEVAAFTNISLDHLDYHGSFEEYFEAKASLFHPQRCAISVIDVGSPMGRRLADLVATDVAPVSLDEVSDLELTMSGSSFTFEGRRYDLPLIGRFNVANALVAIRCAQRLAVPDDVIATGLAAAAPVPGRVERIDAGQDFDVLVDYAHTPDGLAKILTAARELAAGRVVVVFGCGGDRDRTKRPEMGYTATDLADEVFITSDNPRTEDPVAIIDEVLAGVPGDAPSPHTEPDRRTAIAAAFASARAGDVVVIAGKGHEVTQTVGDDRFDFDDRVVARELLAGPRRHGGDDDSEPGETR